MTIKISTAPPVPVAQYCSDASEGQIPLQLGRLVDILAAGKVLTATEVTTIVEGVPKKDAVLKPNDK